MYPTEEPESLNELRRIIIERLREEEAAESINISKHGSELILRADLPKLSRRSIRIEFGPDLLTFRRHSSIILSIVLNAFHTSATHRKNQLELKVVQLEASDYLDHVRSTIVSAAPIETYEAVDRVLRTAVEPLRKIFVTRALNAVAELSKNIREVSLQAASSASSDVSVLLRALEDAETTEELRKDDPLLPARLRGIEARQQLLEAEGGTLAAEQVAKLLSISRQAVDKRRRSSRLLGVTRGRRGYAYPVWQFSEHGTLPDLEPVLKVLSHHDPWMQIAFMLNANTRLDGSTPLSELRKGRTDAVLDAARSYGEHGAS
jgi:hypothetical protein